MTTISIGDINSLGIASEMRLIGATEAALIGSGGCPFFAITNPANGFKFRVADTNSDPVWEEEDAGAFAELAESCGVEL